MYLLINSVMSEIFERLATPQEECIALKDVKRQINSIHTPPSLMLISKGEKIYKNNFMDVLQIFHRKYAQGSCVHVDNVDGEYDVLIVIDESWYRRISCLRNIQRQLFYLW